MLKAVKFFAVVFAFAIGVVGAQQAKAVEYKEHVLGNPDAPVTITLAPSSSPLGLTGLFIRLSPRWARAV